MALRIGVKIVITTTDEQDFTGSVEFTGSGVIDSIQALREADAKLGQTLKEAGAKLQEYIDYNNNSDYQDALDTRQQENAARNQRRDREITEGRHGQSG